MNIFPAGGLTVDSVVLWYHSWNRLTFQFQFCSILPKLFPPYSGSHYQIAKPLVLALGKDAAVQIRPSLRLSETRDYLLSLRGSTGKMNTGLDWTNPISKKLVYFKNYFSFIWTTVMCAGELGMWCPQRQRQGSLRILFKELQWCWLSLVALLRGWRAFAVPLSGVGTAVICFSGGNKLHLVEIEVCEINVYSRLSPHSYWIEILLKNLEVLFQTST